MVSTGLSLSGAAYLGITDSTQETDTVSVSTALATSIIPEDMISVSDPVGEVSLPLCSEGPQVQVGTSNNV